MSEETSDQDKNQDQEIKKEERGSSTSFIFKGGVEIFPFEQLPHLAPANLSACRAQGRRGENLFAVFCDKDLFPRTGAAAKYISIRSQYMADLIASGVSDLSKKTKNLLPEQKYIFVFENIYGAPLWKEGDSLALNMRPELVKNTILPSLVEMLEDLKAGDLIHGSLHAGNVFAPFGVDEIGGGEAISEVLIGECLSVPFSYAMPALYLPIHRANVSPIGRGRGVFEDEIYSLGVLLSVLLRKTDPCDGQTAREVLESKMTQSSYQAVVGDNRIDVYFLNALRGMLQDDPGQRWTLEDVLMWVEGHRIGPKQGGIKRLNANRPLPFCGKTYVRPEILALDFENNIADAHQLITGGELSKWIDRSVANPALKAHMQIAFADADKYGQKPGFMERKVAQVALMLNNGSAVFYKEVKFLPDGIGLSIGESAAKREELSSYAELMDISLIPFWIEHQERGAVDEAVILADLESCRMSLKQQGFGYGVERCVYILCEEAPCLSPLFDGYYLKTPEDYFLALNDMCIDGCAPDKIIDRHSASFLSVRDSQLIDAYLMDINSKTEHLKALATLRMLATIQLRSNMGKAVGISNWIVDNLSKALLSRLHDRDLRKNVAGQLKKIANNGDIVAIATLFEKETALRQDQDSYAFAMNSYQGLLRQEKILDYNIQHNKKYGQGAGREVASIVSATTSFVIVMILLLVSFGDKLVGG